MTETREDRRPLRADAERTMRTILEVADRTLRENPNATLQQIADAAGVARTTVHRRFATREALIEALVNSAMTALEEAIDAARPDTAPPLVALHQVTANAIKVKSGWRFAATQLSSAQGESCAAWARIMAKWTQLCARSVAAGLIRADVEPEWAQDVYYALLERAINEHNERGTDVDVLAARLVETLLHGIGTR